MSGPPFEEKESKEEKKLPGTIPPPAAALSPPPLPSSPPPPLVPGWTVVNSLAGPTPTAAPEDIPDEPEPSESTRKMHQLARALVGPLGLSDENDVWVAPQQLTQQFLPVTFYFHEKQVGIIMDSLMDVPSYYRDGSALTKSPETMAHFGMIDEYHASMKRLVSKSAYQQAGLAQSYVLKRYEVGKRFFEP